MTSVDKDVLRTTMRQMRAGISAYALASAANRLAWHILHSAVIQAAERIAAYIPVGTEPGSTHALDAVSARGCQVLLPIVAGDGLQWALYQGPNSLLQSKGLLEPAGPRLDADALETVDLLLVPALAVDKQGNRLGRGRGHYDRALAHVRQGKPTIALLHDGELVSSVPVEKHDRPVTSVITPSLGWVDLSVADSAYGTPAGLPPVDAAGGHVAT